MAHWQKAWNGLTAAVPWGVQSLKGCCQTVPIFGNYQGWWFHYPSSETSSFADEGIFETEPIFRVSRGLKGFPLSEAAITWRNVSAGGTALELPAWAEEQEPEPPPQLSRAFSWWPCPTWPRVLLPTNLTAAVNFKRSQILFNKQSLLFFFFFPCFLQVSGCKQYLNLPIWMF